MLPDRLDLCTYPSTPRHAISCRVILYVIKRTVLAVMYHILCVPYMSRSAIPRQTVPCRATPYHTATCQVIVCCVQGYAAGTQCIAARVRQPWPGAQGQAALLLHAGAWPRCGQCLCWNPHRCLCQGMLPLVLTFLPSPPNLSTPASRPCSCPHAT